MIDFILAWLFVGIVALFLFLKYAPDDEKDTWGSVLSMVIIFPLLGPFSLYVMLLEIEKDYQFLSKKRNFPWTRG